MNNQPDMGNQHNNQERLFRERTECVPDWMWEVDLGGVITYSNPVVESIIGYAPSEVEGRVIFDFMPPDDAAKCRKILEEAIRKRETIRNVMGYFITKDSSIKTAEICCVPMFDGENLTGFRATVRDITDLIAQQRIAQEAEANYRALVENSQTGIFIVQNEALVFTNPRIEELMGYTSEEALGSSIWKFVHPDDVEWLSDYYHRRLAGEDVPTEYIARGITKSGEIRYLDFRAKSIQYKGAPAVLLNAVDITERKQAEEALVGSEERYRSLFENNPNPMLIFDLDTLEILAVNEAAIRLYGYSREEFLSLTTKDIRPPEDIPAFLKKINGVMAGFDLAGVWRHLKKDGSIIHVAITTHTLTFDGRRAQLALMQDITERKEMMEKLKQTTSELEAVFHAFPDRYLWLDSNGTILNYHTASEDDLYVSAEQFLGKRLWEVLPDDVARQFKEGVSQLLKTRSLGTLEYPLKDKYYEARLMLLPDDHIFVIIRDITDRKRAEQALQEAEAKYRSLVEENLVGVYLIQDGRFVYVNPRIAEIFGYSQDEIVGKPIQEFVAPENRALVIENVRKRVSGEIPSIHYNFRALQSNGRVIDVEVHGVRTIYNGKPAVIGSLMDITERKRYIEDLRDSEQRYRQLFEHSPDIVFVLSERDGTIVEVNPSMTAVLGYEPHEVLGRTPWDISPEFQPDGIPSKEKAIELIEKHPESCVQRFEWVHMHKGGALVDCEVSLAYYKVHGEMMVQAIVRDVTQRKQAEESRRRLEEQLESQKRSFYRETIMSVTGGKLNICDDADILPYKIAAAQTTEVNNARQVAEARRLVEGFFSEHGLEGERLDSFMIGTGEAITNAIKHGVQGQVFAGADEKLVYVGVSDKGRGIESLILPRATLLRGFSTKPSLGLGYSIMLDVSDRILLHTGEHGTTVVLIKDLQEQDLSHLADRLPDTWNNIPG